jgi:hypothetical protein
MLERTSLIINKYNCLSINDNYPKTYYRCNKCDTNLTSNTPANQYQRQKIIQNTVRVPSSLYTMNVGSLSAYQKPSDALHKVYWNQMSDRKEPSVQKSNASGTTYHSSSTKSSITRLRPGAMSPGGVGCDIKHNSYDRYLNKLKGKSVLRRGTIPYDFGVGLNDYKFNRAFPIYGGKTTKLNIINGCNCPLTPRNDNSATDDVLKSIYLDNTLLLNNPYKNSEYKYIYKLYDVVYFMYDNLLVTGKIISISNNNEYLVEFDYNNELRQTIVNYYDMYSDTEINKYQEKNCNCSESCNDNNILTQKYYNEDGVLQECKIYYNNVFGINV